VRVNLNVTLEEESAPSGAPSGVLGNNEEDDGLLSFHKGSLDLEGGTISSIGLPGFANVPVPPGGVTLYFDALGQPIPEGDSTPPAVRLFIAPNGNYSLSVVGPLQHAPGEGENFLGLPVVTFSGVTGEGGEFTAQLNMSVQDDIPVVTTSGEDAPTLMTSDRGVDAATNTGQEGTENNPDAVDSDTDSNTFNGTAFVVSFGADGPKLQPGGEGGDTPDGYAFGFQIGNGGATGLYATGTSTEIILSASGNPGEVVGRDGSGNVILTLVIDPQTGAVVMTQTGAIRHDSPDGEDGGSDELQPLAAGVLAVVLAATTTTTPWWPNSTWAAGCCLATMRPCTATTKCPRRARKALANGWSGACRWRRRKSPWPMAGTRSAMMKTTCRSRRPPPAGSARSVARSSGEPMGLASSPACAWAAARMPRWCLWGRPSGSMPAVP
jgi:hypothetical protein